ncbi:MAG: PrgI family protein [Oscillospiraceae bacterium]
MIAVRIPKEIKEYKEKIAFGLTGRQIICSVLMLVIAVPLYVFGRKYIQEDVIAWLVILIGLPLAAIGFVKKNGMPFEKFIAAIFKSIFLYPSKRKYRTNSFFKGCQNKAIALEKASRPRNYEKERRKASYEKCFLTEELMANGVDIMDIDMEVLRNDQSKKTNKEKKLSRKNTPQKNKKAKQPKKKSKFETKYESIVEKQASDVHYLPTKAERKILLKWQKTQQKKRNIIVKSGKSSIAKKNSKIEKRKNATTSIPKSTQDTIPYIADYDDGLFEVAPNKFSKTFKMTDINYSIAKEEDQVATFCKWGEFLNHFSEEMNIAVTIDSRIVSPHEQEFQVFYPLKGDAYDEHRKEYNKILKRQIIAGKNDIQQNKYVTVTIDCDNPYEALIRFSKIETDVIKSLGAVGSNGCTVLSTDERLSLLHDKFRPGREGDLKIDYEFLKKQGLSSKDYIAPTSFHFEKKHFTIDDNYYRCMFVSNMPASLSDEFLKDVVDVEFPLITTLNIQPVAQDKALKIVKHQLTGMESNKIDAEKKAVKAGYNPETISHELKQAVSQAEELLDDMTNKNQKMFFVTISLMVSGKTLDELEENCKTITNSVRKFTCQVQNFDYQQEAAFKVTLPLGVPPKNISVERTLTTESTAVFMPFSAQELFQPGGFYYGLNQISRNLILCNRTKMKTPSGFILGSSGSGKSFAAKREMLNVLLNDDKTGVLVIDPENEYGDFARAFGGTVISISADSSNYINPLDMPVDYGLDENDDSNTTDIETKKSKALQKKSEYIMSIIQCMISDGSGETTITPQQKTLVDRSVKSCYKEYLDHDFDIAYAPSLMDFQNELDREKSISEDGRQMAEGVEYYTKGSMDLFSHKTNVSYNNRFVVFNIRDLGTQLKQIALLIVLDFIWNRMIENFTDGVRTYCYIDEIHVLFQNEFSARFLAQLYKRGRKYGLVPTGITQNVEDLLRSEMARGMIGNSEFIMMLSQASDDLKILANMLHISEAQMEYVNRSDAGSGLLFAEKVIVPFVDKFPKDSYLYDLMSTAFDEEKQEQDSNSDANIKAVPAFLKV